MPVNWPLVILTCCNLAAMVAVAISVWLTTRGTSRCPWCHGLGRVRHGLPWIDPERQPPPSVHASPFSNSSHL